MQLVSSIIFAGLFLLTVIQARKSCSPDALKFRMNTGECFHADELFQKCQGKEVQQSVRDCATTDGNWCCYVNSTKTGAIPKDITISAELAILIIKAAAELTSRIPFSSEADPLDVPYASEEAYIVEKDNDRHRKEYNKRENKEVPNKKEYDELRKQFNDFEDDYIESKKSRTHQDHLSPQKDEYEELREGYGLAADGYSGFEKEVGSVEYSRTPYRSEYPGRKISKEQQALNKAEYEELRDGFGQEAKQFDDFEEESKNHRRNQQGPSSRRYQQGQEKHREQFDDFQKGFEREAEIYAAQQEERRWAE